MLVLSAAQSLDVVFVSVSIRLEAENLGKERWLVGVTVGKLFCPLH